jgi:hypothetical protein
MNDEFERIWKNAASVQSRYYPFICLEGLGRTTGASFATAGDPAGFRPVDFPNTSVEHYRYENPPFILISHLPHVCYMSCSSHPDQYDYQVV